MNVTIRLAASLAIERSDAETLALLEAVEVPLPDFTGIDLDVAFGTPLEMCAADPLPHEQLDGLDITAAIAAIEARENRTLAASDIAATEPTATKLVRERLVDMLLPHARQLRIAPQVAGAPVPLAARRPSPAGSSDPASSPGTAPGGAGCGSRTSQPSSSFNFIRLVVRLTCRPGVTSMTRSSESSSQLCHRHPCRTASRRGISPRPSTSSAR
ncbi:hypothetical protein [Streptomyces sp900116325]|uniref:hypothetical protein n=1 Tax=Streptomyces sp. 900116325 TaxID=3154295 RepID=UPI00340A5195